MTNDVRLPVVIVQLLPAAGAFSFLLAGGRSIEGLTVLCTASVLCAAIYVFQRCGVISFAALFVLCYVALYLLYPWSVLILGLELPRYERVAEYTFLTVVGLSFFLVAHALAGRRRVHIDLPPLESERVSQTFWIFMVPMIGSLIMVALSWPTLGDLLAASRLQLKEESGAFTFVTQYLWVAGSIGLTLGPLYLRGRALGWVPFLGVVALAAVGGFLAFRTRSVLVLIASAILVGLWLRGAVSSMRGGHEDGMRAKAPTKSAAGDRERKAVTDLSRQTLAMRPGTPALWRLALLGVVAVVAVSYVRIARGMFEEQGVAGLLEVDVAEAVLHNLRRGDLAYAPVVFDVLDYVPERAPHLKGRSYYRLLFVPVPRAVWPDKPPNTQRIVASWLYPDRPQQTTPPGIQGDLYINFGLAGVLGFIGFGWLFGLLDRWRGLGRVLAIGGGIIPVFHLVRGGFTNPILLLVVLVIAALAAASLAEGRLRITARRFYGSSRTSLASPAE